MSGPVVGKMHKGAVLTRSAVDADEAGAPHRAAPAGPVPRGVQHEKEEHKPVGRNSRMPR